MFFTEWVTRNYLLVNISMLRLENLDEWILQQMPEVEVLEFHCDLFQYETLLPNHRGQKGRWDRFTCTYINLPPDDRYTIYYTARKQRPEKPTIAFLEAKDFHNSYTRNRWLAENSH